MKKNIRQDLQDHLDKRASDLRVSRCRRKNPINPVNPVKKKKLKIESIQHSVSSWGKDITIKILIKNHESNLLSGLFAAGHSKGLC